MAQATTIAELIAAWKKAAEQYADTTRTLEKRITELREDHDALAVKYERLRGRVYGAGLHKENGAAPSETREQTKARVLASRFTPGKPANHAE